MFDLHFYVLLLIEAFCTEKERARERERERERERICPCGINTSRCGWVSVKIELHFSCCLYSAPFLCVENVFLVFSSVMLYCIHFHFFCLWLCQPWIVQLCSKGRREKSKHWTFFFLFFPVEVTDGTCIICEALSPVSRHNRGVQVKQIAFLLLTIVHLSRWIYVWVTQCL